MAEFLKLHILGEVKHDYPKNNYSFRSKPFAASEVFESEVKNYKLLTKGEDVKRVYELELAAQNFPFMPGDAIGILPCNDYEEVQKLFNRLGRTNDTTKTYTLEVLPDTKKKNPTIPKHLPPEGILEDLFLRHVDIRKPPKKVFLRALVKFTDNKIEQEGLEELCTPKGSDKYLNLIDGSGRTLLGLLNTFPSCKPPLEVILEHSQPLQPRFFSISSSPLAERLTITFFVVEDPDDTKGVCTGWLENVMLKGSGRIPFYFRNSGIFRIPDDASKSIIMIASGTGIAPFKSFLDHRSVQKQSDCDIGKSVLYYGCRYSKRDLLYKEELEKYIEDCILTKMYTAFSRDTKSKCYVQDQIDTNGNEFVSLLFNDNAMVFICGDPKTMGKDVFNSIIKCIEKHHDCTDKTAHEIFRSLVQDRRILVDTWT